jgi:hypothetical protein
MRRMSALLRTFGNDLFAAAFADTDTLAGLFRGQSEAVNKHLNVLTRLTYVYKQLNIDFNLQLFAYGLAKKA